MIELEAGKTLEVTLKADTKVRDRMVVALRAYGCAIDLTPHQARVLATELIMALNRAEVRNNLKHSQSMVRGTQPGIQKRRPVQSGICQIGFKASRLRLDLGSRQPG